MTLLGTAALVLGTVPLSAVYLRYARPDAPLILGLYCLVAAGLLGRVTAPSIAWQPDAGSLFGVQSVALPTARRRFAGSARTPRAPPSWIVAGHRPSSAPKPSENHWPYQKKPL